MTTSTAVLQIHQRDVFERNVTRALGAGAGAGFLTWLGFKAGVSVWPMLSFLALAGVALTSVRGDRLDKLMLAGLGVVLPAVPWLFGLPNAWTVGLSGAAAGALMVRARACEKGGDAGVGISRPGAAHYVLGSAATGALAVAGLEVARVLAAWSTRLTTPVLFTLLASGMVVALFASIGGLAAHLMLQADPVEARAEAVIPELAGELQTSVQRALTLYRQCGESLAALGRDAAREQLARTLQKITRDSVELAAEWNGVEQQLAQNTVQELEGQIAELRDGARNARDPIAKKQLELAAASLKEELDRLQELGLKRERIFAKLKGQLALLERAKVALIGMRSGHAQIRSAELSALARKFGALASAQADEAKLAHEAATGAELANHEAELARAVQVAEGVAQAAVDEGATGVVGVAGEVAGPDEKLRQG